MGVKNSGMEDAGEAGPGSAERMYVEEGREGKELITEGVCERGRVEMEEQEVSQVARAWEQGRGGTEKRDISRGKKQNCDAAWWSNFPFQVKHTPPPTPHALHNQQHSIIKLTIMIKYPSTMMTICFLYHPVKTVGAVSTFVPTVNRANIYILSTTLPGAHPFCPLCPTDTQRDFPQRPGSAYVTDEIWRKAGELEFHTIKSKTPLGWLSAIANANVFQPRAIGRAKHDASAQPFVFSLNPKLKTLLSAPDAQKRL